MAASSLLRTAVPTREEEVRLRLEAQNVELQPPELILPIPKGKGDKEVVYQVLVNGKNAKVVLTKNSMEIRKGDGIKPKDDSIIKDTFLEKHLEDVVEQFDLYKTATLTKSYNGKFIIMTLTDHRSRIDKILDELRSKGIGDIFGSQVSVVNIAVYQSDIKDMDLTMKSTNKHWIEFIQTKITVVQIVESFRGRVDITFDWIAYMLIASYLLALGLLENSVLILVAAFIIAQTMGAILSQSFALFIRDWKTFYRSIIKTSVGMNIGVIIGFVFGIYSMIIDGPWWRDHSWPSRRITALGDYRGFLVECIIGIPTGFALALSELEGDTGSSGSQVGTALSAALLGPSVRVGLMAGMASYVAIKEWKAGMSIGSCHEFLGDNRTDITNAYAIERHYIHNYKPMHCNNIVHEFAIVGTLSLAMGLATIVIVAVTSLIIYKVKEVGASKMTKKRHIKFWKEDVKFMRTLDKEGEKDELLEELCAQARADPNMMRSHKAREKTEEFLAQNTKYLEPSSIMGKDVNAKNSQIKSLATSESKSSESISTTNGSSSTY